MFVNEGKSGGQNRPPEQAGPLAWAGLVLSCTRIDVLAARTKKNRLPMISILALAPYPCLGAYENNENEMRADQSLGINIPPREVRVRPPPLPADQS